MRSLDWLPLALRRTPDTCLRAHPSATLLGHGPFLLPVAQRATATGHTDTQGREPAQAAGKGEQSVADVTRTTRSEPLEAVDGSRCPPLPDCCPPSIGTLSAIDRMHCPPPPESAVMRSEGAIGPALEAASSWSWALPECNVAISFLALTYGLRAAEYTTSRGSPPSAICSFRHGSSHNRLFH